MKKGSIVAIVIAALLFATTGCSGSGNLSKPENGTYKSDVDSLDGLLSQSWTFTGTNEITLTAVGGLISTKGTYTIDGEKLTITLSVFGSESISGYTITEITKTSFFIDGTKFVKQ
ncbi:MAG: hypothetical protein FWE74_05800 [Oscillospiraceae bacterium]|nr:hypothetical protein [Oscillospiraceae bacterium]